MSNKMYNAIKYIYWNKEAERKILTQDEMRELLSNIMASRSPVASNTKRCDFTEQTYKIDRKGDHLSLYCLKDGRYYIYTTNEYDNAKNNNSKNIRADREFDFKFRELNNISIRKAYGFVDKEFKRCIPKQFFYINKNYINKEFISSSIDASSQYPSCCICGLPDSHTMITVKGRVKPTQEYPFAFYKSGHCAEYNVFDTHDWLNSKYVFSLFRFDKNEEYSLVPLNNDQEETTLMKASCYTMDSTWNYFYNIKQSFPHDSEEYKEAKNIMNKTIGCWHRKDKEKKSIMNYDDKGSYQLAHIVAIAIGRGNQKILNKIKEIGELRIAHICVDGIIYAGNDIQGIDTSRLGIFSQEYIGANTLIKDINVYAAEIDNKPVKFKHGSYDLIYGEDIPEKTLYGIKDLEYLDRKERLNEVIENGKKEI